MLDATALQALVPHQRRHQFGDAHGEWASLNNDDSRISLVRLDDGRTLIVPTANAGDTRAVAGDGVAVSVWRNAPDTFQWRRFFEAEVTSERAFEVDQTNESIILDEIAVFKWQLFAQPSVAPEKEQLLYQAGFSHTPQLWGHLVHADSEDLIASVVGFIPKSEDGWTWCPAALAAGETRWATELGVITAQMHRAFRSGRCSLYSESEAPVPALVGAETQIIHGDLHVGQILRSAAGMFVIDFDGDPLASFEQKFSCQSPLRDVASLSASFIHAGMIAIKNGAHRTEVCAAIQQARREFEIAYEAESGIAIDVSILDDLVFQLEQRELAYAREYLPRWLYAPEGALEYLKEFHGR